MLFPFDSLPHYSNETFLTKVPWNNPVTSLACSFRIDLTHLWVAVRSVYGYYAVEETTGEDFNAREMTNRSDNARLLRLVESYRIHGHRCAKIDPLDLMKRPVVPALDPRRYGFSLPLDAIRPEFRSSVLPEQVNEVGDKFDVTGIMQFPANEIHEIDETRSIEEISTQLEKVYCSGIGYEVIFI
jgi:probable 2-oxoglutarate dehydrogenase E1 component DHKTD1